MGIFLEMLNNDEILTEGKVYSEDNICIIIEPSENRNYGGDIGYFKIYNAKNVFKAKKMNRISITTPKYVKHNLEGKDEWILDSHERKILNKILYETTDESGIIIYDKLFNEYLKAGIALVKPNNYPDYRKLNGYI